MPIRYRLVLLFLSYFFVHSLAKADCQAPQYVYTNSVTYQSAYLSWSYYYTSGTPAYQLQWRAAGAANWTVTPVQTSWGYSLTDLTNNTNYEWRVRTICAAGDTSAFSPTLAFQTKCFPPSYPNTTTVGAQSVRLNWNAYYGGTASEVQWRPAGAATWTIVSNITTGYLTLNGLSSDTYFEWKVRTVCSPNATSDFVDGPLFQTQCPVPTNLQVTLSNPDAVELKWSSLLTGVRFDLQWRQAGASTWTLVENLSSPEYILAGLTNETTYEWQVRTVCTATSRSDFSEIQTIRTRCPIPTGLTTSLVSHNSATLQWTSSVPVTLQWRPAGTATWTTVSTVRSPYALTGLANNTVYEWRVQAICSSSNVSVYTAVQALTTRCVVPVNLGVATSGTDGLQFSWGGSVAGEFDLQYRPIGTSEWSVRAGIVNTYLTVTGLMAGVQYEWRVRRACSATESSDFMAGPLGSPVCGVPNNNREQNLTSSRVDLVWDYEPSGVYELQWRPASTAAWTTVSNLTTARYTLTNLSTNVSYLWQVRRICSATAASLFSYSRSFVLPCQQPYWFFVSNQTVSSATLNWYVNTTTNEPYELQYRPGGSSDWTSVSSLTATQYTLTNLTVNTTYEWRVRSVCATDFSAVQTFRVQCGQPISTIYISNVGISSADLRWTTEGNTNLYEIQYRDVTSPDWISIRPEGTETDRNFGSQGYYTQKGYTLYGLATGKTYEWRFRTICSSAIYSEFVSGGRFTTACVIPSLANAYQPSSTALTIQWYTYSVPTLYELQWRPVGVAAWNVVDGLTTGTYTLNDLTPGASYEYRVRQQCAPGVVSNFSTTATTSLLCLPPVNFSASVLSATSVRINWLYATDNAVGAGSRVHELQYRVSETTDWTTISGITGTTYVLTGLVSGTSYQYRVRAVCQPGVMSEYSYTSSITLTCPVPYFSSVQTESTRARFAWDGGSANQQYVLRWRVAGTSAWSTVSVTSGSYLLTGLTNNTAYEWQIASDCGNGYLSDFTSVQSFQTNCPAVSYLSVSNVGTTKAQLTWTAPTNSFGGTYTVQYRIGGSVVWTTVSGLTTPGLNLTDLVANVAYEARVQSVCGPGTGSGFTAISTFQTQCSGISYAYATNVTTQSAQLVWNGNVDGSPVDLQWRVANSNNAWNRVNGLTNAAYSLTGLMPQTTYEFRVQAVCGTGGNTTSAYSGTFQTASLANYLSVLVDSVAAQSARIRWPTEIRGKTFVLQWRDRTGNWNTSGPLTSNVYLLTDLTPNRTYEVRVGYIDLDNSVVYGSSALFTTSCPQITNTITYNITSTSALLTWTDTKLPVTVQWRVGGVSAWTSLTGVTGGRYVLTGLSDYTTYEWRIQTLCSADVVTTTPPVAFRTQCQMPTTTATQNLASTSAQLTWSGIGPAYSVRYRVAGTTTWTTINSVTATSYTVTGLAANTTYEWAAATMCDNASTTFTSLVRFTTQCAAPTNLNVNSAYADRAQLIWSGPESSYQLQWRAQGSTEWHTQSEITSPYLLTGLTTGINYEWRLRSACAIATDSPFVTGYLFSVACPTSYSYNLTAGRLTSSTAQLIWTMYPPGNYTLRYRSSGTVTWTVVPSNVSSPYTLTGLTNDTVYEWQIRSDCQTDFVALATFQTSCGAPGSLRTETITTTSAQLRWNDSGENVAYEVQWRVAGTSVWNSIANVTSTGYLLTGLTTNTAYEWQVRSQCTGAAVFRITNSFRTGDACAQGVYTLRAGSWDDVTVWSCGRLPLLTDPVQLKHALTIPDGYTAKASAVYYQTGATLLFGVGSVLRTGP